VIVETFANIMLWSVFIGGGIVAGRRDARLKNRAAALGVALVLSFPSILLVALLGDAHGRIFAAPLLVWLWGTVWVGYGLGRWIGSRMRDET
jgi:hypothetical protein